MARRWARLDRCLVNAAWISNFASYSLTHISRIFSDHVPLLLSISSNPSHRNNFFKLENYWCDYISCQDDVWDAWNFSPCGTPLHAFTHFLHRSHVNINLCPKTGLTPLDIALKNSELAILDLECLESSDLPDVSLLTDW